jgi:tetratricopeptide (TPR) repeat protein
MNQLTAVSRTLLMVMASALISAPIRVSAQNARPDDFQTLLQKAQEKTRNKEQAEAAKLWAQVVERNPVEGRFWDQLARAYSDSKDYRKSIAAYEKALELRFGYPFTAAYNIACSYALMGEKEQAFKWLEKSLDMGFRDLNLVRTDTDFDSIRNDARFKKLAALDDVSKMSRDEGWRYDLWLLARELQRIHYDPYKYISKPEFDASVKKLNDEIPKLTDNQIAVSFMKLMRLMGDGHTQIRPGGAGHNPLMAGFPVEFYLFKEGLFITAAAPQHADLVGAQVIRLGDHSVEKVFETLDTVISQDNKMWVKFIGANMMKRPSLMNGLGLIASADRMQITVRDSEGKTRAATLVEEKGGQTNNWLTVRQQAKTPEPLYLKNRRAPYWFEYIPESKTVFFQYNAVQNDVNNPLPQFCDKLFKFINENEVERLVIDMRWNSGGNNFLNRPILQGLLRNDKINQRGKLFVIIGRQTFSAAMNGATDIDRYTNVIFAGEPTGSSPNFVGESVRVNLPYSKMQGSISDLYWQSSVAMDYRTWIAPLLYAPPSFELYKANRDPAMEAILSYRRVTANP